MTSDRTDASDDQPQPTNEDPAAWRAYWLARGLEWRTDPEINGKRKDELATRRAITPDPERDEYPFKDEKLNRSDVEWLLATHDDERGPVGEMEEDRQGLDLRNASLRQTDLSHLPLRATCLEGADLWKARLEGAFLGRAHLEGASLHEAHLEGADLGDAHLEGASLLGAHLEGAYLSKAHLEGAFLGDAHLEGKKMDPNNLARLRSWKKDFPERLSPANLRGAFFDMGIDLSGISLADTEHVSPKLADVRWNGVNLAVVNWKEVYELGDEHDAVDLEDYEAAVRANRQLAIALREQGINEVADRFFYRSQVLQRKVFRLQRQWKDYLLALFSWSLAGYGYRPWWTLGWYLGVVFVCGWLYYFLGIIYSDSQAHQLSLLESFVISVIAFHGRGFWGFPLNDLQSVAAVQAFLGLGIEIAFIVTFTQRFFGK
jgi:uncharacterized protein YjbI with pentapeptide repeats